MATYKKRGYKKPKEKIQESNEQLNADGYVEGESTTEEVFDTLDNTASKAEEWVAGNQRYIYGILGLVAIAVIGYILFLRFVSEPKQQDARNEMYQAETYFTNALNASGKAQDSLFNLALNGGEGKYGFIKIADEYSGSKAGALANYYAGTAYLNIGKYKEAIDYLDKFESDDMMLGAIAKGAIGDAFVQLDQLDQAIQYYEAAAKLNANDFTTPKYLQKAGVVALTNGNKAKALEYFTRIKEEFPNSDEGKTAVIDAYIGRASAAN